MLIEALADLAKLVFFVASADLVLLAYTRRRRPHWAAYLTRRRLAVLGLLTLAMSAIKVIEDVVAQESGPIDTAALWFVREHVPAAMAGFFAIVTRTGSVAFLTPATVLAVIVLLLARRRFEAVLMGATMISATLLVYGIKTLVGRVRPALWETQWYSGSSFPSGHTLSTAAFATAASLCLARIWPRSAGASMFAALLWSILVAFSRLVLGVHWPSDVIAALCVGVFTPLFFSVIFDKRGAGRTA